jgi:hypothetical protein
MALRPLRPKDTANIKIKSNFPNYQPEKINAEFGRLRFHHGIETRKRAFTPPYLSVSIKKVPRGSTCNKPKSVIRII